MGCACDACDGLGDVGGPGAIRWGAGGGGANPPGGGGGAATDEALGGGGGISACGRVWPGGRTAEG